MRTPSQKQSSGRLHASPHQGRTGDPKLRPVLRASRHLVDQHQPPPSQQVCLLLLQGRALSRLAAPPSSHSAHRGLFSRTGDHKLWPVLRASRRQAPQELLQSPLSQQVCLIARYSAHCPSSWPCQVLGSTSSLKLLPKLTGGRHQAPLQQLQPPPSSQPQVRPVAAFTRANRNKLVGSTSGTHRNAISAATRPCVSHVSLQLQHGERVLQAAACW